MKALRFPAPYFGGKAAVANVVWAALGQPKHYVEPFFGSGAVLLARPDYVAGRDVESVCDADGYLANVWRALQHAPDDVAKWCDWPCNHADLNARRRRLLANEARLLENLQADDEWCDAKLAGYWLWAASCWIGSGLTRPNAIPHISNGGKGVHAMGQIPHISDGGKGVQEPYNVNIYTWFRKLAERLRYVRVVCGDWTRVCGGNWQDNIGTVGMFFDPPYGSASRDADVYHCDSLTVAADVDKWVLERGANPNYRIVVAGYNDEHQCLTEAGWRVQAWTAQGGYSVMGDGDNQNRHKETLWFSPHCRNVAPDLFSWAEEQPTANASR